MKQVLYTILTIVLFQACTFFQAEEDRKPVARVYDKYLYEDELSSRIPKNVSSQDSTVLARSIIKNWVEKQLLVYKAETNLPEEKKNVDQKLQEYRYDLLIYAYQSELLEQKLDTVISDKEIEAYYTANQDNFQLKDYIVKVRYVKLEENAPKVDKVRKWMVSKQADDRTKLEDYCYQFASNFYLDDNSWLYLDDLLKEVPLEVYNKEQLLRSSKLIEYSDSTNIYLVKIADYKLKDGLSPLSLERENIKAILMNKRKKEFINKMKQDIFDEALRKNNFETFEN